MARGRVYSVQVGAFRGVPEEQSLRQLGTLTREDAGADGWLRLFSGRFDTEAEARRHLSELRAAGLSDAFVVVYINGRRTPLLMAGNTATMGLQELASTAPLNGGLQNEQGVAPAEEVVREAPGRQWQVQLGTYASTIPVRLANAILDAPLDWGIQSTREDGLTRYVTRLVNDEAQAQAWLETAREMGFVEASMVELD